jgi:hypothetical protein
VVGCWRYMRCPRGGHGCSPGEATTPAPPHTSHPRKRPESPSGYPERLTASARLLRPCTHARLLRVPWPRCCCSSLCRSHAPPPASCLRLFRRSGKHAAAPRCPTAADQPLLAPV